MEFRHLKYFVAVAEALHFGRAAQHLGISAPTLSNQIRTLETSLSTRLLHRKTSSSVSLTDAGKRFLSEARAALNQLEKAERVARRAGRGEIGTLALGYVMSAASSGLLQLAIGNFRKTRPEVSFQLIRSETFPQMDAIANGQLDIGFTRPMGRYPTGLTGFVLLSEPYVLAIPSKHPLARKRRVAPADIIGEPLIAASLQMEVGFWDNLASLAASDGPLNIVARAADMLSVIALAASGVGISAVSQCLQNMPIPGVVYRPISGAGRRAELAAVHRKNESNQLVRGFINTLRSMSKGVR
jgi:DNA-binding transcriptional LysR family regulator